MRTMIFGALLLAGATPAWADQPGAAPAPDAGAAVQGGEAADQALIVQAAALIKGGKSGQAIPLLDQIVADEEKAHASETRQIFCARSTVEALLYAGMGAGQKKATVVLGAIWSTAIFLKGFAYVDLGLGGQSRALFEQAIALSPQNAQFLAELGEWYKARKDWPDAYARFQQASDAAAFSPDAVKNSEKRRALRGMGFVLTEEGKFDAAEALYNQCLALDPGDAKAKAELDYIRGQRAKAGTS